METHKRREWVKTAAIILLLILLALTFFSNTIMNMTLAEVSTVAIADGSISAKVRATGKVAAVGNNEVKAEGTRTIAAVKVKEGQEVSEGDILFVMGEAGSEELEVAQDARDSAYYSYERAKASYPIDTTSNTLGFAEDALDAALNRKAEAEQRYYDVIGKYDQEIAEARAEMLEAEAILSDKQNTETDLSNIVSQARESCSMAEQAYYWADASDEAEKELRKENWKITQDQLQTDLQLLQIAQNETIMAQSDYNNAKAKYEHYVSMSDGSAELSELTAAENAYNSALASYESAYNTYYSGQAQYAQSVAQANINAEEAKQTLDKKQTKLDNLQGVGEDINVYAKVNGIISSIGFSSGDKVTKDDVMCVIEVPDMGYTLEATVTKDQANRLKVGDVGEQANYYWGKSTTGTITSIKADKRAPQEKRIITFELEGDVTNGQEITLSVGSKTASYDYIVPKSAVKSDNNGSFVLVIDSKSNALGNRYFARRVNVEILAEDDSYRAISGDIGYGDFVITNSSTKVNSGDQVRLADTQ